MNKNKSKSQRNNNNQNMHPNSNNTKKRRRGKKSRNNNNINNNNNNNKSKPSNNNNTKSSAPKLSYASRISSSSTPKLGHVKQLRIRSLSSSSTRGRDNTSQNTHKYPLSEGNNICIHGPMSREELLKIRMQQRDICYVAGLPKSICTRQLLGSKKWFGQFGKIRDITITDNQNCIRTNWMCVHIKYFENISASKAVKYMNHKKLDDGRVLEANYGTQRYCEFFINNKKCHKSNCPFRHSWCKINEIVNFNNHHQIINNNNNNYYNNTRAHIPAPVSPVNKITIRPQPQPQQQQQQQHEPMVEPIINIKQSVNSVPSTSSTDNSHNNIIKQNDIISHERECDENIIKMNDMKIQNQYNNERDNENNKTEDDNIIIKEEEQEEQQEEVEEINNNNNKINAMEIEINSLYSELHGIKEENVTYKNRIIEIQTELSKRDNEIIKLQRISRKLVDSHAMIKQENDKLKYEIEQYKRRFNINIAATGGHGMYGQPSNISLLDYTLWEWHDVYQWLMNIQNGYFQQYSDLLKNNLKLENIDGACIKCLSTTDIHRIGITDFKDKQIIIDEIKRLKSNLGLDNLIDDIINGPQQSLTSNMSNMSNMSNNMSNNNMGSQSVNTQHTPHSIHSHHSQHSYNHINGDII